MKTIFLLLVTIQLSFCTSAQTNEKPKSKSLKTFRTLFGVSGQGMYSYENGVQKYNFNEQEGYLPNSRYYIQDGLFKYEIQTPIINYSKTYTFQSFSNDQTNTEKYQKTHFDFIALKRLKIQLDKMNRSSDWMISELILPIYDRKIIKTDLYEEDDLRVGVLYNIISFQSNKRLIRNTSYSFDNQTYSGDLEITNNRFYILDLKGWFDAMRIVKFTYHALENSEGEGFLAENSFQYGMSLINWPYPIINIYIPWGEFTLKNNGEVVNSGKFQAGGGFSFGLGYSGLLSIEKFSSNILIVPELYWIFWDKSFQYNSNDPETQNQPQPDYAYVSHTYLYAGIGIQFFF